MAEFINPFPGVVPDRKLTLRELTRAIRQVASILIGRDLGTSFVGPSGRRYEFAVSESVALQLRDPSTVCVLA
jgi:hypothetical protein